MKLSGTQIQKVHQALLNAYPRREDLSMMVRFELDVTLSEIVDGSAMGTIVFSLVEWAEANGPTEELLIGARNQNRAIWP